MPASWKNPPLSRGHNLSIFIKVQSGECHFIVQGDCPYESKGQNLIKNTASFLVLQAFKATQIWNSGGQILINKEDQDIPKVNLTCGEPLIYARTEADFPQSYPCEFTVQQICYDYKAKIGFDIR